MFSSIALIMGVLARNCHPPSMVLKARPAFASDDESIRLYDFNRPYQPQ